MGTRRVKNYRDVLVYLETGKRKEEENDLGSMCCLVT